MHWWAPGMEASVDALAGRFRAASFPEAPEGFAPLAPPRPMRQVLAGLLEVPGAPPRRVVVKWSRPVTTTDRVARWLRGGKGCREGALLDLLGERGLPVPPVLGYTDEGVDVLVLGALEGTPPPPCPDAPRALRLAVARLLGRAFRAGLRQRDWHRGNLLVTPEGPALLDLGRARRALAGGLLRELAALRQGLLADATRSDRLRLLHAWREAATGATDRAGLRSLARRAERAASRSIRRYRRGRDRRPTRSGRHYEVFRAHGALSGVRSTTTPRAWLEQAARWLEDDPRGATPLKADGRASVATLPGCSDEIVLKRFAPAGAGRLPGAVRAFRRAVALRHRHLAAPEPLLAVATTGGRSLLVSRRVGEADLHAFAGGGRGGALAALPPARRRLVLSRLGRFLRTMHDEDVSHRDLKALNLCVEGGAAGTPRFWVTDLEGARVRRLGVGWRRRARDLARLDASLDARATDRARVLAAYWDVLPRPPVGRRRFVAWLSRRVARKRGPSNRPR